MVFIEAGDQEEERSRQDNRLQPWRGWWPPTVGVAMHKVANERSAKSPWMSWCFNERRPFEKPWLGWVLPKPSHYSKDGVLFTYHANSRR